MQNTIPKNVSLHIAPKCGSIEIRPDHDAGFVYLPVTAEHEGTDTIQFGRNLPDGSTIITSIRVSVSRQLPVSSPLI